MAEYSVIFKNETDGKYQPISLPNSQPSENGVTLAEAERKQERGINTAGLVAVNQITPYITQAVNFQISQLSMTVGSDEVQRKAEVVSSIVGNASGIVMGAITGGVAGAAIMAGVQAVNTIVSTQYNRASIQNQKRIENENLASAKSRTGLATNRSRTGGVV